MFVECPQSNWLRPKGLFLQHRRQSLRQRLVRTWCRPRQCGSFPRHCRPTFWSLACRGTNAAQFPRHCRPTHVVSCLSGHYYAYLVSRTCESYSVARTVVDGPAALRGDHPPATFISVQKAMHICMHLHVHMLSLIHISEPTRPERISYAVFCLKKKK